MDKLRKKVIYLLETDTELIKTEYPSYQDAYTNAQILLQENPSVKFANVVKYTMEDVGVTILQKK